MSQKAQRSGKPFMFKKGWQWKRLFLAGGDSYGSQPVPYQIPSKQLAASFSEVCEDHVQKLKDYIQVSEMFWFMKSLKLYFN